MIRHLTSKSNYESIIKDGVIKPRKKKDRDFGVVSFEKLNENNILVNIIREEKNLKKEEQVVAILIDDEELIKEGFNVYYTDSSLIANRQGSRYTTKYENITRFGGNELNADYINIGEYVHVEGEIPISFIKDVKFYY